MKDLSLVEKAKKIKSNLKIKPNNATKQLILAWIKDEVTIVQCKSALEKKSLYHFYSIAARNLKEMYLDGKIIIKDEE